MARTAKNQVGADRLASYGKGTTRAGKSKSTEVQRKIQNVGTKDGTIRLGKSGKTYNVYDAASGTWKRGVVKPAATAKPKPKSTGAEGPKKSMPATAQRPIYTRTTRFPRGTEVGPAVLGVKAPKDGATYVFGPPNERRIYKWNKGAGKFTYVSPAPKK
jgi:hypothetical protein